MKHLRATNKLFKQYRRKQIAELRPVRMQDINCFKKRGGLYVQEEYGIAGISVSPEDIKAGSPKYGDMIARNPKNHLDQWLVAEEYFKDNFEEIKK